MKGKEQRLIGWLLLCMLWSGLMTAAQLRGGATEWFALIVLTGVILFGAAAPMLSLRGISVKRSLLNPGLHAGAELRVRLEFRAGLILPMIWIAVKEEIRNTTNPRIEPVIYRRVILPWLRREYTIDYVVRPLRRGELRFEPVVVTAGDLFGLTVRQITLICEGRAVVLPELIGEREDRKTWQLAETRMAESARTIPTPVGEPGGLATAGLQAGAGEEVRSYSAGDPLRYLDWRGLAKGRSWQTRKESPEEPLFDRLIAVDCSEVSFRKEERLFDACISKALWAFEQALLAGSRVRLYCGSSEPVKLEGHREARGSYMRAADRLARVKADSDKPLAWLLTHMLGGLSRGGTAVVITTGLQDWREAVRMAVNRGCRMELWLIVGGKAPSYALREGIRDWETYGCKVRVWTLPAETGKLTEALEGDDADEGVS
ncbi:DUF58 domain-containing protein [Paenibacillus abyssi]|uniref:DUF58 domain-containing protein n=1 Tax=Paenibacillus abyssi TaxID=1340531 RepID=A0A917G5W8_9BACL|nr:DUF58 domain-containing protein [Paenibacillus abyssi]GGG23945.1 hypothetical protein GCM10010916_45620 [Paenibacillus abyssi]